MPGGGAHGRVDDREPFRGVTAAFLFLTGWVTVNETMCGSVDAAVCLVILAVMFAVMQDQWWLVPFFVAIGSLAKETAMLFSLAFVFTWIGYVGLVRGVARAGPTLCIGFGHCRTVSTAPLWYLAKDVYKAHLPSFWTLLAAVPRTSLHSCTMMSSGLGDYLQQLVFSE